MIVRSDNLLGKMHESYVKGQEGRQEQALQAQKAQEASEQQATSLDRLRDFLTNNKNILAPGQGIDVGGGVGTQGRPMNPYAGMNYQLQKDKFDQGQQEKYSKTVQPFSDVKGAFDQLDQITNRDGKGGIISNPDAQLVSAGKIESSVPDGLLGMGEMLGALPKGTMEERKAVDRVKLSLGHAMTGARMNPSMQKLIQDSIGQLNSGDPQLMAKGLRAAKGIVDQQVQNAASGFQPGVVNAVAGRGGIAPGQGPQQPSQPTAPSTPPGGFDPDAYLKGR